MRRSWATSALISVCLVLGGLPVLAQESTTAPGVPVGPDVSYFVGTSTCEWGRTGREFIDGVEHYAEFFSCVTETTDPRMTGTEELPVVTYNLFGVASPWTADSVFTSEDGSWRGRGQGMVDLDGASPLGTPGQPFNYGEMTYVGEGAYEGLAAQVYLTGTNGEWALSGWIAPAE